ncbi:hypothetical protein C8J35_103391 [Rhizobium sp. PP-F2F-G38]|nr:hypothetical protein C8J37_103311 [Rhizobium sp. PP-WC-1G-195]PYE98791.1 hypothetical protein C8J35_103391 [Rhizobium sp. PP-F2F-G38]
MNKIVREHYPASRLPEDLRTGLQGAEHVRVVIEAMDDRPAGTFGYPAFAPVPADSSVSGAEMLEDLKAYKAKHGSTTSEDEAVSRIRKLRDEWDDE